MNGNKGFQFTYTRYRQLLTDLIDAGFSFTTYGDHIDSGEVILRHDIDLSVERSVRMAEIEASVGVQSTYFFLLTSRLYNVLNDQTRERIDRIQSLGHDIGLHFSTHQYYTDDPGDKRLVEQVETERDTLESMVNISIDTVSFHIPPEWILRRSFAKFTSTYEQRFFTEIPYKGDSSQRWRTDPPFAGGFPEKMQILVHPGLWGEEDAQFETCVHRAVDETTTSLREFTRQQYIDDELAD